ncbi:hypothetical protein FB45DRAFT_902521, partial [Roridomyces roridus]
MGAWCSHVLVPLARFRLLARLLVAGGGVAVYKLEDEDAIRTVSLTMSGASVSSICLLLGMLDDKDATYIYYSVLRFHPISFI